VRETKLAPARHRRLSRRQTFRVVQGRNHGWKVEGDQGLGPNTGALAPRARSEAGLGWVREGVAPSGCGGPGCYPGKFLKTDAKSCILVASALLSGLPRTCISEQTTSMSRAKSVAGWISTKIICGVRSNNDVYSTTAPPPGPPSRARQLWMHGLQCNNI